MNDRIKEIRERLKQLEVEKNSLLDELTLMEQVPTLPLIFGANSSSSVPKTSEEKIELFSLSSHKSLIYDKKPLYPYRNKGLNFRT